MTEDEMVGWHHRLNGYEFEQAPGDGDGQGGLVCCSPWSHQGSDTAELLNSSNPPTVMQMRERPWPSQNEKTWMVVMNQPQDRYFGRWSGRHVWEGGEPGL